MSDVNDSLVNMKAFVFDKKFVSLPEAENGVFYSGEVYAFLCVYDIEDDDDEDHEEKDDDDHEGEAKPKHDCVLYFWEGRHASPMGWLSFKFQFLPRIEKVILQQYKIELKYE